jgi:hypothetical protein
MNPTTSDNKPGSITTEPNPKSIWFDTKHIITYIIVVVGLAVVGSAIYAYRNQLVKEGCACITKSWNPPDPTTSNWKTYANSQYGFEFNYPGDLNYIPEESDNFISLSFDEGLKFQYSGKLDTVKKLEDTCGSEGGMCFDNQTIVKDYAHDLTLYNSTNKVGTIPCNYESYGQGKDWRSGYVCKIVQEGDIKYLMVYKNGGAPYGIPTKDYIYYKNGKRYEFIFEIGGNADNMTLSEFEKNENEIWGEQVNQILSTFKFVETK